MATAAADEASGLATSLFIGLISLFEVDADTEFRFIFVGREVCRAFS
jgi:hypothetical protein